MNKKARLFTTAILIMSIIVMSTGCSILFKKDNEAKPATSKEDLEEQNVFPKEEEAIKGMIDSYFMKLYGQSVESYSENVINGTINQEIREFIAGRTISEGENNPEIGLNMPRYVEMNGMTITSYEVLKDSKRGINSSFIEKRGDAFLYFVKVDLKAKGLSNVKFNEYYVKNEDTGLYEIVKENGADKQIDESEYDVIKVQAKYDVEVIKDGESYKIVTQKEANYKMGLKNRLFTLNNEFLVTIPYLDMDIAEEKSIFETEKAVLEAFSNNFMKLDRERMTLLQEKWSISYLDFMDLISKTEINKADGREIMIADDNYKGKFNINSFPIQLGMQRIKSIDKMDIQVHPGYSKNKKYYFVKFEAKVINSDGLVNKEPVYIYDYTMTLKDDNGSLKVESIKLNELYKKPDPKPTSTPKKVEETKEPIMF